MTQMSTRRGVELPPFSWARVGLIGAVTGVAHLAVASRYGWHRDELYYSEAGRHLAFGYVDQPPLTPLLARLADLVPGGVVPLRLAAIAAQVGCVLLAAALGARARREPSSPDHRGRGCRRVTGGRRQLAAARDHDPRSARLVGDDRAHCPCPANRSARQLDRMWCGRGHRAREQEHDRRAARRHAARPCVGAGATSFAAPGRGSRERSRSSCGYRTWCGTR